MSRTLSFLKMHGLGNDYIFVDDRDERLGEPEALSVRLSDRNTGIGSDGLILLRRGDTHPFAMKMFNADGSEGEMCGNGIRCLGRMIRELGLNNEDELTIETAAGEIGLSLHGEGGAICSVTVDMGPVRNVCVDGGCVQSGGDQPRVDVALEWEGAAWQGHAASMGNPHCVFFVDDVATAPVEAMGSYVEHHKMFPHRTNVEFVQVVNRGELIQRTWERGSGETRACGTGACAVAVVAMDTDRVERDVVVHLPGGDLMIRWDTETNRILMTGPAELSFRGEVQI